MADVDLFKRINDTHGHLAGDYVLTQVATAMKACLRRDETLVRYGGEEFALVVPETNAAGALALAERLRAAVAELELVHDGQTIPVSISLGVAELATTDKSTTDLVQRADQRLFEAKRAGRNCVRG